MPKKSKPRHDEDSLRGWQQIAAFLGQPITVVQRWARSGMPVERKGRYMFSSRADLNRWLAGESAGEPVQITTQDTDLASELKRGLSYVRRHRDKRRAT